MKTESEKVPRWDDIIFENRNKAYGAYAIRKSYEDTVLTGWLISLGVIGVIFLSSFFSIKDEMSVTEVRDGSTYILPPPDLKPIISPKAPPPAPKHVNTNIPPVVTKNDVPDQSTDPVQPPTNNGSSVSGNLVEGSQQTGIDDGPVSTPEPPKAPPFVLYAEHMPAYEGGVEAMMKFLQKKMRYPSAAERLRDEGTVYVSFIISSTGAVTNVEVVKGFNKDCDREAVRVISMMNKWKPGIHNQMPVAVKLMLPIKFKLEG